MPSHPIAGLEKSGPNFGFAKLFKNRFCILTPYKEDKFIVEIIENDELDYVKMLYKNRELLKEKYDFDIIPTQHEYRENSDDISYNGKKISVESLNYSKENEDYDLKQMILSVS